MLYLSLSSALCACALFWVCQSVTVHNGANDWTTWEEGDSPIIILSQHGGTLTPASIPNRVAGCWDGSKCIWQHGCNSPSTPQDTSKCGVKTLVDGETMNIATCIRNSALLTVRGHTLTPHFVKNNLKRSKLDPNREIGEAALDVDVAEDAYNEIHEDWIPNAKTSAHNQCGFGIIIDVHGQSKNGYIHLGYRISENSLAQTDEFIDRLNTATIRSLRDNFRHSQSAAVRGEDSLGQLVNDKAPLYDAIPSIDFQDASGLSEYYMGDVTVDRHGSELAGTVDAIMMELPTVLRQADSYQTEFCADFAESLVEWMEIWHDLSHCAATMASAATCSDNTRPLVRSVDMTFINSGSTIAVNVRSDYIWSFDAADLTVSCKFYQQHVSGTSWQYLSSSTPSSVSPDGTVICTVPNEPAPSPDYNKVISVSVSVHHTATGTGSDASLCASEIGASASIMMYKKLCIDVLSASGLTHWEADAYVMLVDANTGSLIGTPTRDIDDGASQRAWDDAQLDVPFCVDEVTGNIRLELWDKDVPPDEDEKEATGYVDVFTTGSQSVSLRAPGTYPAGEVTINLYYEDL